MIGQFLFSSVNHRSCHWSFHKLAGFKCYSARVEKKGTIRNRMNKVFAMPGRNENFTESFAWLTWRRRVEIIGIDFDDDFSRLGFAEKVDWCRSVIKESLTSSDLIVGRSFGARIILNALDLEENYRGTVILVARVLGYGSSRNLGFVAPRAGSFWRRAMSKRTTWIF